MLMAKALFSTSTGIPMKEVGCILERMDMEPTLTNQELLTRGTGTRIFSMDKEWRNGVMVVITKATTVMVRKRE